LLHHNVIQVLELVDQRQQQLLAPGVAMVVWSSNTPQVEPWHIRLSTSPVKLKHGRYRREFHQRSSMRLEQVAVDRFPLAQKVAVADLLRVNLA
jgi:hypothetical protein